MESYKKIEGMEAWIKAGDTVRRQDFDLARKEGRLSPEEEEKQLAAFAQTEEYLEGIRKRGPLPTRWEIRRQLGGAYYQFRVNPTKSD